MPFRVYAYTAELFNYFGFELQNTNSNYACASNSITFSNYNSFQIGQLQLQITIPF